MEKKWLHLISAVFESGLKKISDYSSEYSDGVTGDNIQNAENNLGFELPKELKSLLMEFDGIHEYTTTNDGERIQVGSIIWNLSSIVEHHLSQITSTRSKLFCFGSSVLGNSFGYLMVNNKPDENQIWQSDPETDFPNEEIVWRASSLQKFITTSLTQSRWY